MEKNKYSGKSLRQIAKQQLKEKELEIQGRFQAYAQSHTNEILDKLEMECEIILDEPGS